MSANTPNRRDCLLAIGGAGVTGLAGCLGSSDDEDPYSDVGDYEESPEPQINVYSNEIRVSDMGSAAAVFCSTATIDAPKDVEEGETGVTAAGTTFSCDGDKVLAISEDGSIGVAMSM